MTEWLYRYEAKGIQSYVLATNGLKEIAGGSKAVKALEDAMVDTLDVLPGPGTASVHAKAAGAATVLFSTKEELASFVSIWPMVVDRLAPGLQVVQGWIPVQEGNNDDDMNRLSEQLRYDRNRLYPSLPEAGPLLARAARTGKAAVTSVPHKGLMDRATLSREVLGGEDQQDFDFLLEGTEAEGHKFAKDHEKLPERVAVLHIDGNDMGRAVMRLKGRNQYQAFSEALAEATRTAAKKALGKVIDELPKTGENKPPAVLPIRPVVVGGDDVTLLVPSRYALTFVEEYVRQFERFTGENIEKLFPDRQNNERKMEHMTASAGIAYVKRKSPFFAAYDLAEQLCGWTKARLRHKGPGGVTPSAVTFHRVTAGIHTPWSQLLVRELAGPTDGSLVTGAPYLLGGTDASERSIEALRRLVSVIRDMPRGSFREWIRVAQTDEGRALQRWQRIMEVAGEKTRADSHGKTPKQRLQAVLQSLGFDPDTGWDSDKHATAVFDALVLKTLEGDK